MTVARLTMWDSWDGFDEHGQPTSACSRQLSAAADTER